MKVKMKVAVSGPRHDGTNWPDKGEPIDVPDWEGVDLCAAGLAEPVGEKEASETATAPEPEKRATKKAASRKKT